MIELALPKKHSPELRKKAQAALRKMATGLLNGRKSKKHGDITFQLSLTERMIIKDNVAYVFSKHSEYEKFLNR
ncbi:ParE family toxin-like protein [Photobacterium leiognathi]|uniref:ParE family toxin-like protein n=1 Tax=Photobacterium leiognathi TaxID=553611 RepID=UPI0029826080|nr:hypothetical protein [Photobacterium leiognathi]